ncbi:nucleoid-associated protein [uncultured Clostridium sp.]|uniref:nucleoid-associated protein n=1 Tax=uncultured Clostridium sp. TaxID=59620 RepID=UPI002603F9CB|nr:nucleoid-associated protein [uncultured Clostridium sp.]
MFTGEIVIEKRILHILNRGGNNSIKLSDFTFDAMDKIEGLIQKHLKNTVEDNKRNFGVFNIDSRPKSVVKSIINIFNNTNAFIEESKDITRLLSSAMDGTNAKSTNLLILKYQQSGLDTLAIIKLNCNDNFEPIEKPKDGKLKIEINVNSIGFNDNQRLEKAILIQRKDNEKSLMEILEKPIEEIKTQEYFDVIILDRQAKDGDSGAAYWQLFLDCNAFNDSRVSTKRMAQFLSREIEDTYKLEPKKILEKKSILSQKLGKGGEFNLNGVLDDLFETDLKKTINQKINDEKLNTDFEINETIVTRSYTKDVWYIDNIEIKGSSQELNRTFNVQTVYDDGTMDILLKGVKKQVKQK